MLYRSFFALPGLDPGADGQPVNALLGAANVILRIAADREPRAIVVCFGAEAAAYRVELYPAYHAARPPVPDALAWQFEQAPGAVRGLRLELRPGRDLEADDLLGSLAEAEGRRRAGADRDRRPRHVPVRQRAAQRALPEAGVERLRGGRPGGGRSRYGIGPELVPDFIALRGDPSDGLPGAPGIGAKTAAALLGRHGSLEAAIAGAVKERPRIAAALTDHADELRAFRDIATLRAAEVARPPDRPTDLVGGAEAARRLGLNRLAERLEAAGALADL